MEISLAAETLFHIGSFPVTNSFLTSWLTVLVLGGAALWLGRRPLKLVPSGLQNLLEFTVEKLLGLMDSITADRQLSKRFFPIVATIFLSVLISNWLGLFPFVGPIGVHTEHDGHPVFVPLFRSANADLNMTLAIAIVSVVSTQILGMVVLGVVKFWKKYFINPIKEPIMSSVGLLELFGEISKVVSFSFRLFGNVFAGEVLLIVIASLLPFVAPLPFYFLEIFVGFIQAFVFAVLTLVFMRIATADAEHSTH